VFCGSFMPLHGADVIVRAAALLADRPEIRVVLVGGGQTKPATEDLARSLGCRNVSFVDARYGDALREILCGADVLLGVFGSSEKAMVVVPNKVVDALALGKPMITGGTPAIRRLLDPTQIRTVPPGDVAELADAIVALHDDATERARLGRAARRAYEDLFSPRARREQMATIMGDASR
jgi:glycosyltransferase involved in cell wall biosynthesis